MYTLYKPQMKIPSFVCSQVSVIAPNPLVQPEELKLSDKAEAFGSKMPFERQLQADFIGADGKMPAFPSASKPVTSTPEVKGDYL